MVSTQLPAQHPGRGSTWEMGAEQPHAKGSESFRDLGHEGFKPMLVCRKPMGGFSSKNALSSLGIKHRSISAVWGGDSCASGAGGGW